MFNQDVEKEGYVGAAHAFVPLWSCNNFQRIVLFLSPQSYRLFFKVGYFSSLKCNQNAYIVYS